MQTTCTNNLIQGTSCNDQKVIMMGSKIRIIYGNTNRKYMNEQSQKLGILDLF